MSHKLPPHYGHGVSGERFWPRPALCHQVTTALRRGECVTLFGPRRTGKSSLLKECARLLRADGRATVIEVNGEGMDAVAGLFRQFVAALPRGSADGLITRVRALRVPERLLGMLEAWSGRESGAEEDAQLVTRHWAGLARAIAAQIPDLGRPAALLIDELAYLCEDLHGQTRNPEEVKRLLAMLREWNAAGLGLAMASSIGLRQTLRRLGVSRNLLTGCTPVPVGPLAPDDAAAMLAALAADRALDWWDAAVTRVILDESADLLPACLQVAFKHVAGSAAEHGRAPSADEIRLIFRERIRRDLDHELLHQFDERFGDYAAAERATARLVFGCIARSSRASRERGFADLAEAVQAGLDAAADPAGSAEPADPADLADLIRALEDDGFLADDRERDRIAFASRLVETWWQTRDHRRGRRR